MPVTDSVPMADPVKVPLQLESRVEPVTGVRLQLDGVTEPPPLDVKPTSPVGFVGIVEVSLTIAVQLVAWLMATESGVHET